MIKQLLLLTVMHCWENILEIAWDCQMVHMSEKMIFLHMERTDATFTRQMKEQYYMDFSVEEKVDTKSRKLLNFRLLLLFIDIISTDG